MRQESQRPSKMTLLKLSKADAARKERSASELKKLTTDVINSKTGTKA